MSAPPDVGSRMLLSFEGLEPPTWLVDWLARSDLAGVSLFRGVNIESAAQTRDLTAALQAARGDRRPLLVATDQEGGQLRAAGPDTTPFPGNMALGAVGDADLAREVAFATGRELAALGINVNYAPVCDVASNPDNPSMGIRTFGSDPAGVAALAAAAAAGLAAGGIVAVAKHFPGKGEAHVDPHWELPRLDIDEAHLEAVEMPPFRAALAGGARILMVGHYDVAAITGAAGTPTSVSRETVAYARDHLDFDGVVLTDALNMHALGQGAASVVESIAALAAGVDLLLCISDSTGHRAMHAGLARALDRGLVPPDGHRSSAGRVSHLRAGLGLAPQPDLDVVGCAEHAALARTAAARAITLVRDGGLLPLRPRPDDTILAVMPQPEDLTPADTSSLDPPLLAEVLRRHHPRVTEIVTAHAPTPGEIAMACDAARSARYVVAGTIEASRNDAQAALVRALLDVGGDVVVAALRTPSDLTAFPEATTYACTYGILEPSLAALAAALFGEARFPGRLPAPIAGLHPAGFGLGR